MARTEAAPGGGGGEPLPHLSGHHLLKSSWSMHHYGNILAGATNPAQGPETARSAQLCAHHGAESEIVFD